jgi:tRNA(fMet)-specific endonuclease VapC
MTILDTDILTHYALGHEKVGQKVNEAGGTEKLAVTVITRMEILRGRFESILKAADDRQLSLAMQRFQEAESLLNSFLTIPVNDVASRYFLTLRDNKKTKKMKRGDMLIACIALAHDALLVTRNVKDYKAVNGLRVENWAD